MDSEKDEIVMPVRRGRRWRRHNRRKLPQDTSMGEVAKYFHSKVERGVIPSPQELQAYCKEKKLTRIPTQKELEAIRSLFHPTAQHTRWTTPKTFMSGLFMTLGTVFLDVAHCEPHLARFNSGAKYFLSGKDELSEVGDVVPIANKTRESWERAIMEFVKRGRFKYIRTFISDRDVAISSKVFRDRLKRETGIGWYIQDKRIKSFRAERFQRFLKDRFGQGMAMNHADPKLRNCWVRLIDPILDDYNSKFVTGTNIRRKDVDKDNYLEVLRQRFPQAENQRDFVPLSFATSFTPQLAEKVFKYDVGEKVLVSRSATREDETKGGIFLKRSLHGAFAPKICKIEYTALRSSNSGVAIPTYYIENDEKPYYESELAPVRGERPEKKNRSGKTEREEREAEIVAGPRRSSRLATAKKIKYKF